MQAGIEIQPLSECEPSQREFILAEYCSTSSPADGTCADTLAWPDKTVAGAASSEARGIAHLWLAG